MHQDDGDTTLAWSPDKGKGKEREEFDLDDNHRGFREDMETVYPPMNEDAEETRRVEEVGPDTVSLHMSHYSIGH
jgi:predicted phage-related endonuclease